MKLTKSLHPLQVPWMIAPSLSRISLSSQEDGLLEIKFVGLMRCEAADRDRYQRIVVSFVNAPWLRRNAQLSDREVVEEAAFDWSLVPGVRSATESISAWRDRCVDEWISSGIAPNPCAYIVRDSDWNRKEAARHDLKHYLFVGDESSVEVLGGPMQWRSIGPAD